MARSDLFRLRRVVPDFAGRRQSASQIRSFGHTTFPNILIIVSLPTLRSPSCDKKTISSFSFHTMSSITAKALKKTADSKTGVAFSKSTKQENAPLFIKHIKDNSIFAGSGLKPGMVVKEVNGLSVTWKSPKEVADMISQAPAGEISISAAEIFEGEITSDQAGTKRCIDIMKKDGKPGVYIRKIYDDGPFAGTALEAGQQLLSINGTPCPEDTKETIRVVQAAVGKLKIAAIPPSASMTEEERSPVDAPVEAAREVETEAREIVESPTEDLMPVKEKSLLDQLFTTCAC